MDETEAVSAPNVLVKMLRLQQICGGAVHAESGNYVEIDTAKATLLGEVLDDIPTDEPVIVFCRFIHDLDAVKRTAEKMGRTYAELSGRRDDALTSDATLAEGVQVAAVQIQSGGTGVDMTRSRHGIYYSLGFSLSDYTQSRARLHRPGQEHHVRFVHLVASGTIDEQVYEALADRKSIIEYAIAERKRRE
jgi:SNF2 family DNA or RNA helicase